MPAWFRRLARGLAWIFLGLMLVVTTLALLGVAVLMSGPGQRWVQRFAIAKINENISGHVELGALEINLGGWIVLREVRLRDPHGHLVLSADRLAAKLDAATLFERRVRLAHVEALRPEIWILTRSEGSNLQAAIAPRNPPATPSTPSESSWRFQVDDLAIHEGLVDSRRSPQDADALHLQDLELAGNFADAPGDVHAALNGSAKLTQPESTAINLEVSARGTGFTLASTLNLERLHFAAGGSTLEAQGHLANGAAQAHFEAHLSKPLARALGVPLARAVAIAGDASWKKGDAARIDIELPLPEGSARLHAELTPATPLKFSARLGLANVDPSAIFDGAPTAKLNGTIEIAGKGQTLAATSADAHLSLEKSEIRNIKLESLSAAGNFEKGSLDVSRLALVLPGGKIDGGGRASLRAIDFTLSASVNALEPFIRNLGVHEPLQGSADATLKLSGTPSAPAATLALRSPGITLPQMDLDLRQLRVDATIPDLRRPEIFHAKLNIAEGRIQDQDLVGFGGTVEVSEAGFVANLTSEAAQGLTLKSSGSFPDSRHVVTISTLEIGEGPATWSLQAPAQLDLAQGARLNQAVLISGAQRLVIQGGETRRQLDLNLQLSDLNLATLPRLAVPRRLGLQGTLAGSLNIVGARANPKIAAKLQARGLSATAISQRIPATLDVALDATIENHRAHAHAELTLVGQKAVVELDAPFSATPSTSVNLTGRVHTDKIDLAVLAKSLERPELEVAGSVALDLAISGTLASPQLSGELRLDQVSARHSPATSGTLRLDAGNRAEISFDLHEQKTKLGGTVALNLPADPLRHLGPFSELGKQPLDAELQLDGFDLDAWRGNLRIPADAHGVISAQLQANGDLADPRGTLSITSSKISVGAMPAVEASATVSASEHQLALNSTIGFKGQTALKLDAKIGTALGTILQKSEALGDAPMTGTLEVGPVNFAAADNLPNHAAGALSGKATLAGTLDAPELHANVGAKDLALSEAKLGEANASLDYSGKRLHGTLTLPKLELSVDAQQDLGLASLRRGLELGSTQVSATLHATGFDLSALAGLIEPLRTLGGTLTASVQLDGRLDAPEVHGELSIPDGRVDITGYGDFDHIALKLTADAQNLKLTQLEAHSNDGWVKLTASATRNSLGVPFDLSGELSTHRFPVRNQDQILAYLDSDTKLDGKLSLRDSLINLHVDRINAEVPQLSTKPVQPLATNPDIVIIGRTDRRPRRSSNASPGRARSGTEAHPYALKLNILAPHRVLLRGSDINLDLSGDIGLELEPGGETPLRVIPPPGQSGPSFLQADRGWIEVIGRRFEVPNDRPARLVFEGGPLTNANLDATMIYNDRADDIVVTVGITGPVTKPNPPALSSQPPLESSQLALLIATGHLQAKRSTGQVSATGQAGSVVGSLLTGPIQKALSRNLPIDTVIIESNSQGELSAEVGKYITDKIYVGYTRNFSQTVTPGALQETDQNLDEFTLQYRLSRRWQLEAVGGEVQGGFDAIWQVDF